MAGKKRRTPDDAMAAFEEARREREPLDVVEPACSNGGPHRWEIGLQRWTCQACGFSRPPRPVKQHGGWTTRSTKPRGGRLEDDPQEAIGGG